ncbi:MAG: hypothetical protein CL389_01835 [Acidiferrobacteraceae bacterium]|nr:hypothetical protein [Acidiferrobacteraceae bacterium]MDP6918221.1 FimV/HubP family polar landmark protein [Arenicellales bacterium]|tara:strand:- start:78934 stop:81645 length:2712 start_codon:yes stop_codon:yes gene_type:complete
MTPLTVLLSLATWTVHPLRRLKAAIAVSFLLLQAGAAVSAGAIELAGITVSSRLNESLEAAIPLKGLAADIPPTSLTASLASAEAHGEAGIPFDKEIADLLFTVDLSSDPPAVLVRSNNAVGAPFLRFLLAVELGEQRLLRDYTVMLDPPSSVESVQVAVTQAATPEIPGSSLFYPGEYIGPVERGETLMQLARRVLVADPITLEQTMVALASDNPEGFIDGNMNLLREGATLHVPSERQMAATDAEAAREIYENHLLNWLQRQSQANAGEAPTANWMTIHSPGADGTDAATEKQGDAPTDYILRIVQPVEEAFSGQPLRTAQASAADDQTGSSEAPAAPATPDADATVIALTDRLTAVEESLGSKELENQQLNQQVELLQQQLEKTIQLIELQETQLAIAQQQLKTILAQEVEKSAAAAESGSESSATASARSDEPDASSTREQQTVATSSQTAPDQAGEAEDGSAMPEEVLAEADGATAPMPAASGALTGDASATTETPSPAPPWVEPAQTIDWLMDQIQNLAHITVGLSRVLTEELSDGESVVPGMSQQTLMLLAAAVLLLLLLILFRRRRASSGAVAGSASDIDAPTRRPLFESAARASPAEPDAAGSTPPDESIGAGFVTDIETQRGVAVQSDEVDPLTESEIYLAYGRTVQAEQTLRDAILRTPDRIELKLKLLEVLKVLARSEAFLELAAEIRAVVAAGSPEEAHLEKLIRESPSSDNSTTAEAAAVAVPTGAEPPRSTVTPGQVSAQGGGAARSVEDDGIAFEFDLDADPDPVAEAGRAEVGAPAPTSSAQDSFGDLELELESPFAETESVPTGSGSGLITPPEMADSPNDPSMTSESAPAPSPEGEERTQLELANAYLEMGDPAAAREILTALSASENPAIATRAKELLSNIDR